MNIIWLITVINHWILLLCPPLFEMNKTHKLACFVWNVYIFLCDMNTPNLSLCLSHLAGRYLLDFSQKFHQSWENIHLMKLNTISQFLATLAKFVLLSSRKIAKNGGFRPLSRLLISQSSSYVVYTLFRWVFRNDVSFGHVGNISGFCWPTNGWNRYVPTDHCMKYWSLNPLHTWCIHWLTESLYMYMFSVELKY